jgi:hypothetical protein
MQTCCIIKVSVKQGHKDMHNLVCPVASLGAAEQLKHLKPHKRSYVLGHIGNKMGLEQYGMNASKGSLCETSETCVGKIFVSFCDPVLSWTEWGELEKGVKQ